MDILDRLLNSSPDEGSHELQCRCLDAANEIDRLRNMDIDEILQLRRAAAMSWVALSDIRDLQSSDWNGHAAIEAIEVCMQAPSQPDIARDAKRYAALRVLGVEFSGYRNDTVYRVCLEALDDAIDSCMLDMPPNGQAKGRE